MRRSALSLALAGLCVGIPSTARATAAAQPADDDGSLDAGAAPDPGTPGDAGPPSLPDEGTGAIPTGEDDGSDGSAAEGDGGDEFADTPDESALEGPADGSVDIFSAEGDVSSEDGASGSVSSDLGGGGDDRLERGRLGLEPQAARLASVRGR